eukprot:scaffold175957_cov60-Attheya_sp.AAC.6
MRSSIKKNAEGAIDLISGVSNNTTKNVQVLGEQAMDLTNVKKAISDELKALSSNETWGIIKALTLMVASSLLILLPVISIPLDLVNNDIETNRWFLYGMVPCFSVIGMLPWVQTFDFVLPDMKITAKAKAVSDFVEHCFPHHCQCMHFGALGIEHIPYSIHQLVDGDGISAHHNGSPIHIDIRWPDFHHVQMLRENESLVSDICDAGAFLGCFD